MILDGLRYISPDLDYLNNLTLKDYSLSMKAYALREVDSFSSRLNREFVKRAVKATKQTGHETRYVYAKPEELFDSQKEIKRIKDGSILEKETRERLIRIAGRLKDFRKEVEDE